MDMSRYFTVASYGGVCGIEKGLWHHFFGCNACCCRQSLLLRLRSSMLSMGTKCLFRI